jgi:hypothetical protein
MHAKPARFVAALALLALAASSCNYFKRGPTDVGLAGAPTGTDLAVAARFAVEGDDVPEFFLTAMPDSGVVPVRVTIRNNGSSPLVIHTENGMDLGAGFEGFALVAGGADLIPLTPKEAARRFLGSGDADDFRMRGSSAFVAGVFVPPVEMYFVYTEVDVGRYYRPLFGKSFYPGFESGMMKPVRLEPGEERGGYLYFAMPPGARPDSCELLVRACVPPAARRPLPGAGFMFARGAEEPLLFMFGEPSGAGSRGLYLARGAALESGSDSPWTFIAPVSSKTAAIADAASAGSIAACAVNFQAKGKLFLVRPGETPALLEEKSFARKIRHVFVGSGGVFVMTEDAFCHRYNAASGSWSPGVKLGIDIDDTALIGDSLLAFSKARGISFWNAAGDVPVAHRGDKALRRARRAAIGPLEGSLVMLTKGKSVRADTLALLDTAAMGEIGRGGLPGKVLAAATDGSNLVLQFQDGTLARIVRGTGEMFSMVEAGFLPFEARALAARPGGFIAVGDGGAFAGGSVGSFAPGSRGALELSVPVR